MIIRQSLRSSNRIFNSGPKESDQSFFLKCIRPEMKRMEYCGAHKLAENLSVKGVEEFNDCVKQTAISAQQSNCKEAVYEGMCSEIQASQYCSPKTVLNSFYAAQIISWKELYGDNLLVVNSDEFYADTPRMMVQVAKFLGLTEFDWEAVTQDAFNIVNALPKDDVRLVSTNQGGLFVGGMSTEKTSSYPPMNPEIRAEIEEFFRPLNKATADLVHNPNFWFK